MPGRSSKLRSGQLNQAIYSDTKVRLNAVTERERQQLAKVGLTHLTNKPTTF